MTREEAIKFANCLKNNYTIDFDDMADFCDMAINALEQAPRKGEWLRMSSLSEQQDGRYQCSRCRNVVRYRDKMNLYTFNSWCGRCGSDNGRKVEVEV